MVYLPAGASTPRRRPPVPGPRVGTRRGSRRIPADDRALSVPHLDGEREPLVPDSACGHRVAPAIHDRIERGSQHADATGPGRVGDDRRGRGRRPRFSDASIAGKGNLDALDPRRRPRDRDRATTERIERDGRPGDAVDREREAPGRDRARDARLDGGSEGRRRARLEDGRAGREGDARGAADDREDARREREAVGGRGQRADAARDRVGAGRAGDGCGRRARGAAGDARRRERLAVDEARDRGREGWVRLRRTAGSSRRPSR